MSQRDTNTNTKGFYIQEGSRQLVNTQQRVLYGEPTQNITGNIHIGGKKV
jgi:hypothetical protein